MGVKKVCRLHSLSPVVVLFHAKGAKVLREARKGLLLSYSFSCSLRINFAFFA